MYIKGSTPPRVVEYFSRQAIEISLDSVDMKTRQALQPTLYVVLESFGGVLSEELSSILYFPSVGLSQLVNDVIESRSKVMETITDGQNDAPRHNKLLDLYKGLLRFRIMLDAHVVVLCLAENF